MGKLPGIKYARIPLCILLLLKIEKKLCVLQGNYGIFSILKLGCS